jgi:hypothetical protein
MEIVGKEVFGKISFIAIVLKGNLVNNGRVMSVNWNDNTYY